MTENQRVGTAEVLPEFLRISIEKGLVDEPTARRIELFRRSRGGDEFRPVSKLLTSPPDRRMTFDNFIPCKGNSFALELAKTVASRPPDNLPYNPLYIYGDVGLGKTHILSAIANATLEQSAILVSVADLEVEFERARRLNTRAELRQWLASADILLLDDIQLSVGDDGLQVEIFSVLNHITKSGRWVVISSDVPPTQLKGMESRLMSRLGGGVIVSLQMGDKIDRIALVRHFARHRSLPEDVLEYVASTITGNVRLLKGAVAQLIAANEGSDTPVTMDLARALIPVPEEAKPARPASMVAAGEAESLGKEQEEAMRKVVARFKEMLVGAETEEEQALALQIALGERIRQLRQENADPKTLQRFESALEVLREGDIQAAMKCLSAQ